MRVRSLLRPCLPSFARLFYLVMEYQHAEDATLITERGGGKEPGLSRADGLQSARKAIVTWSPYKNPGPSNLT